MTNLVVAISRQMGSGGGDVGRAVAERRGLRCIDGAMLRDASEYLREHDPDLEQVGERMDTWWSAMSGAIAMGGLAGFGMLPVETAREAEAERIEQRIIEEIAQQHAAVIIGRGATHLLRDRPGVVRVFVHAPEAWRIERVAERAGVPAAQARTIVRESDRNRAGFVRALAGADWTDARDYDLTINMAATGLEAATGLVLHLLADR